MYEYRSKLNAAACDLTLEDPTLLTNREKLISQAKRKVEEDGYVYKKKKSRSIEINPAPIDQTKNLRLKKELRIKQISNISEDLDEVKKEIFHLERSREKARNVNADEKALRLSKEMEPLRKKKRQLEEELQLLQQKEAKSSKDKERRKKIPKKTISTNENKATSGCLDAFMKKKSESTTKHSNVESVNGDAFAQNSTEKAQNLIEAEKVQVNSTSAVSGLATEAMQHTTSATSDQPFLSNQDSQMTVQNSSCT